MSMNWVFLSFQNNTITGPYPPEMLISFYIIIIIIISSSSGRGSRSSSSSSSSYSSYSSSGDGSDGGGGSSSSGVTMCTINVMGKKSLRCRPLASPPPRWRSARSLAPPKNDSVTLLSSRPSSRGRSSIND